MADAHPLTAISLSCCVGFVPMLNKGEDVLEDLLPLRLAAAWALERDNENRHYVSLLLALVAALGTGRTDVGVHAVFGAGKTRASSLILAAAVYMSDAEILVVAKENVALRAVAEYLHLPLPTFPVKSLFAVFVVARNLHARYPFDVHPDHGDLLWPNARVRLLTTGVLESVRRNDGPHAKNCGGLLQGRTAVWSPDRSLGRVWQLALSVCGLPQQQ